MSLKSLLNQTGIFLRNNSSNILTALSVIGVGMTVYTSHQDTLKAEETIYYEKPKTTKDMVAVCWKDYIPTGITALSTIGCIIGSHYCDHKKAEALTSAYLLSQTTLQAYQEKVIERIGKNKERDLREEVYQEIADKQQPTMLYSDGGIADKVIETGKGNTLFYDEVRDIYFKSDLNYLKAQRNDLNYEVRSEMEFDWNEILYRWNLPRAKYGSDRIMTVDHPFDPTFVPEMMENGQVRIVINYDLIPRSAAYS